MSLYGSENGRQDSLIANLKKEKVDKIAGIFIPPTENPNIKNAIWNDGGVLKISTGL